MGRLKLLSLRSLLPLFETEFLIPLWLLLAILSAMIAEVVIIGTGVERLYGLWVGWPIGLTVASVQALGSQLFSRAAMHNAQRKMVMKRRKRGGEWEQIEDRGRSEPELTSGLPLFLSLLAGTASAVIGLALYQADGGLGFVDAVLATASPAGSVGAALLNGWYANGELALRRWKLQQAELEQEQKKSKPREVEIEPAHVELVQKTVEAEPAAPEFVCPRCAATVGKSGRQFGTVQALNAHLRFCVGSNGKEADGEFLEEVTAAAW